MKEIAEKGNSDVQYNLGLIYSNGEGVDKDLKEAIYWFKKSASLNNVLAEYKLGYMYDNGLGIQKDYEKAYKYYDRLFPDNPFIKIGKWADAKLIIKDWNEVQIKKKQEIVQRI